MAAVPYITEFGPFSSQYFVLPWVLRDYASSHLDLADPASYRDLALPVGAQTEARRELFRERYSGWADSEVPCTLTNPYQRENISGS